MVEQEKEEITSEPFLVIAVDNSATCAICARENNLLRKLRQKYAK